MWPPLRSALLIKTSNTASIRRSGRSAWITVTGRSSASRPWTQRNQPSAGTAALGTRSTSCPVASSSTSTQACSDPGPSGPSTNTVTGTQSKPPSRDTSYAATSR